MAKQKVISFEELKENFCLETTKQRFLDFKPAKNNLDNYLKTRKEVDLQQLVGSVLIQCKSYFEKMYVLMTYGILIFSSLLDCYE